MSKYDHKKVEKKWQKRWDADKVNAAKDFSKKEKYYCLIEFPYPSGDGLHVGHVRPYTALDIVARKRRLEGYNVLYPFGFDAFGLPTENYAIKTGVHPSVVTEKNIKKFTNQLKSVGFSFDWERVVDTSDPKYYKWTQWIFLKLFEQGLAYKQKAAINWCRSCKIGLANEEVVNGVCERCGGEVEKREKEQWLLKITKYAERLIEDLDLVDYVERIKTQQINWIGKSTGAEVDFKIIVVNGGGGEAKSLSRNQTKQYTKPNEILRVYTTRPDTLFGATFMVVAPEHEIIKKQEARIKNQGEVKKYIENAKRKSDLERVDLNKEKTGIELKGIKVINPVNGEAIPIFVADYVMMGYGTGAIMAVPAHDQRDFEFAKKYGLEIRQVIKSQKSKVKSQKSELKEAYEDIESGVMINSSQFDGMPVKECIKKITVWLEKNNLGEKSVNYKLRDWVFSRQHYWGEPIPLVDCQKCGWVPVSESQLPVELPKVEKYQPTDTGESPLAAMTGWVKTKCPRCGGPGVRETDTMPNWAGSNWYFLRYCDPNNNEKFADPKKLKYWMGAKPPFAPLSGASEGSQLLGGVDWYNGGMEHTTLHLLYSRFIYKFLWDVGAVPRECGPEPYRKRTAHGMVLGEGSQKMSKSRGNVVTPDEVVAEFGADVLRLYEMFIGPFEQAAAWDKKGILGVERFLNKIWKLGESYGGLENKSKIKNQKSKILEKLLHQTIKKVGDDIENMRFNTAVSAMMIFVNEMAGGVEKEIFEKFLIILAPFAPHICEEIWEKLGHHESIFKEAWPSYDAKLAAADEFELVVQINGKVRDKVLVSAEITEAEAKEAALKLENVKRHVGDKKIKKVIFVKGRLVNLVV